jgi:hypothetical protein
MIEPLAELLRHHGVPAEEKGGQLRALDRTWDARIVRELDHAIQLDVRIELWPGRWLVESVSGLGSGEEARADALAAFASGPLHVILDAFGPAQDKQVQRECWQIGQRPFDVVLGPLNVRGRPTDASAWFASFRRFIEGSELPDGVHWIRVFHAWSNGRRVVLEILLDNRPWPEAVDALADAPWPTGEGFVSVRSFCLLRGGLDVTEVAAAMLVLDDDTIIARFGPAARRAISFLELAFGRVLLERLGVELSAVAVIDGRDVALADDPVYRAALAHAHAVDASGPAELYRTLALRSAEVAAVNQALNAGSRPQDLVLSPPNLRFAN